MLRRTFKIHFTRFFIEYIYILINFIKIFLGIKHVYRVFLKSCEYPALDIITQKNEKIEAGKEYLCRDLRNLHKKVSVVVEKSFLLNEIKWENNKILYDVDLKVSFKNYQPKMIF